VTVKQLIIVGGGFAGVMASVSAARLRDTAANDGSVEITLINATPFHHIRVRNYLEDLESTRYPLQGLLDTLNVTLMLATVTHIDEQYGIVTYQPSGSDAFMTMTYDALVLASGSALTYPAIPGLETYSFNIDTYDAACRLRKHLSHLSVSGALAHTIVVIGSGFVGLEVATELADGLFNVMLLDHDSIARGFEGEAHAVVMNSLATLSIQCRPHCRIKACTADGLTLESGEFIATKTIICATGLRASHLTDYFAAKRDRLNRLVVDDYLSVPGARSVFAAGDVACAHTDDVHTSVMSCQHGRPQGAIAGYNAMASLFGLPLKRYRQAAYVTCLDLGKAGAVFTKGWDRMLDKADAAAKAIKHSINFERIVPPAVASKASLHLMVEDFFEEDKED
jgi:NADH dehydrogenase